MVLSLLMVGTGVVAAVASGGLYVYKQMMGTNEFELQAQTKQYEAYSKQAEVEIWHTKDKMLDRQNAMSRDHNVFCIWIVILVIVALFIFYIWRLITKYCDKKMREIEIELARYLNEAKERMHRSYIGLKELQTNAATERLKAQLELQKEVNRGKELDLSLLTARNRSAFRESHQNQFWGAAESETGLKSEVRR